MSDKMPKLTNEVRLVGKLAEVEIKTGKTKKGDFNWMTVKGAVKVGTQDGATKRFEKYVQEKSYDKKNNNAIKTSKVYPKIKSWAESARSIADSSYEEATNVNLAGQLQVNDYVNSQDQLKTGLNIVASFFNDIKVTEEKTIESQMKAEFDVQGRIASWKEEEKNEEPTGRLIVNVHTADYAGELIPVRLILPEHFVAPFEAGYEEGQTAEFRVDYVLKEGEVKETESAGGLGVGQRTVGASYLEAIIVGIGAPKDEDQATAISDEAYKIAKKERKSKLDKLKAEGYKGKKDGESSKESKPNPAQTNSNVQAIEEDDDIPF